MADKQQHQCVLCVQCVLCPYNTCLLLTLGDWQSVQGYVLQTLKYVKHSTKYLQ